MRRALVGAALLLAAYAAFAVLQPEVLRSSNPLDFLVIAGACIALVVSNDRRAKR